MATKQKKPYIRYSDEQIERARNTDMVYFLESMYGWQFKRTGQYYVCKEHNSLNIESDRKTWHWNSQEKGGLNAVSWLMDIENRSFQEALKYLVGDGEFMNLEKPKVKIVEKKEEPPKIFELPQVTDGMYKNVFMYLTKTRCISPDIVNFCFHKKIIYQEKDHRNIVFVGRDENGIAKFAEVKSSSTNSNFRINVSGSDKRFSFHINADVPNNKVFVFEAPIDLLSHATLNQISAKNYCEKNGLEYSPDCWKHHNRLSLSGTSYVALESYLERNPHIKEIGVCLDNDEAGERLANSIFEIFTPKGYTVTRYRASHGKDYNDMLKYICDEQNQNIVNQTQCYSKGR